LNPRALTGGWNYGIPALGASEHCGIMTAVVALFERARSARRTNILVAIVACQCVSLGMFLIDLNVMGDGLATDLGAIYTG
jgi:hypothetical protein